MVRPTATVGEIVDLTVSGATGPGPAAAADADDVLALLRIGSGLTARLSRADPRSATWLSVLSTLRSAGLPAYLEVDPESQSVSNLLVPLQVYVEAIATTADGLAVTLVISHAEHLLRRDSPDFEEFSAVLEDAQRDQTMVWVTETVDGSQIIDVRPAPAGPPKAVDPPPAAHAEGEVDDRVEAVGVPLSVAEQLFVLANGRTCCSANPTAPGIPFTFPDDGCWGRAHEMCRLFVDAGYAPEKIWIYGQLRVGTANHPSCEVRWGWHVAPIVRVDTGAGPQVYVIDPALFAGPVPQPTWVGVQGDPAATAALSSAAVFYRSFGGAIQVDPTYAQTNQVLTTYRAQLQLRSASSSGPPPYVQCLARPPGVQWFGTLAAHASNRWFTFGWPAAWHLAWTVMPVTICSGAPQLTWSVAVERADSGRATYWITVTNLTPHTVRFEGRYDVLSR